MSGQTGTRRADRRARTTERTTPDGRRAPCAPPLLLAILAGIGVAGVPGPALGERHETPSAVDWVRAGFLVGIDLETGPTTSLGGAQVGLFGLGWGGFYLLPLNAQVVASGNRTVNFDADLELGWRGDWKDDQVRVGVGLGYGFWGHGRGDLFVQGACIRPAARYRRYWDDVGVEVSVQVPLVVGPGNGGPGYAGSRVVVRGWSPMLGVTVGM